MLERLRLCRGPELHQPRGEA